MKSSYPKTVKHHLSVLSFRYTVQSKKKLDIVDIV